MRDTAILFILLVIAILLPTLAPALLFNWLMPLAVDLSVDWPLKWALVAGFVAAFVTAVLIIDSHYNKPHEIKPFSMELNELKLHALVEELKAKRQQQQRLA